MPSVMKTLLLNPPSFEKFDGGASSRWPATREIESYWYPVWLVLPGRNAPGQPAAGRAAATRLPPGNDAHRSGLRIRGPVYLDRRVLQRSEDGARHEGTQAGSKSASSDRTCRSSLPRACLPASISILSFAANSIMPLWTTRKASRSAKSQTPAICKDGKIVHNPSRPMLQTAELDSLPFATEVYEQRFDD